MSAQASRPQPLVAIVDDEEDILTFLGLAFADRGFTVVSTSDSRQALSLLEAEAPDLILLDLLMPEQTGVALYGTLCEHPELKRRPIVIMSGLAQRGEIEGMLQRSGSLPAPAAIVEKPIDIEELLELAERLLGRTPETAS